MNLTRLNQTKLSETKDVPGLLSCRVDYEIKSAQGRLDCTGPPIAPELWHSVLSFFRWTHKETHSESQVRLYVTPPLRSRLRSAFNSELSTVPLSPLHHHPHPAWRRTWASRECSTSSAAVETDGGSDHRPAPVGQGLGASGQLSRRPEAQASGAGAVSTYWNQPNGGFSFTLSLFCRPWLKVLASHRPAFFGCPLADKRPCRCCVGLDSILPHTP